MGKRYICEVKKDNVNNELELVNTDNYHTIKNSSDEGNIKFINHHEMNKYFNKHCISEHELRNDSNNLFMFLFFILLLIFMVTIICQMMNKSSNVSSTIANTSFGRFSF